MIDERDFIHPKERKYLVIAMIASIITYLLLIVSISGIIFLLSLLALSLFANALVLAFIRTNGVKLSDTQFPEVYAKTKAISEQMAMPTVPDIYVLQSGGALNAFATRFFGRNMVVLYAEIFELINQGKEDELAFIIAHELAHIKRRHITKQLLILPAMWIPFLSNAYSRACEYTCDRFGSYYSDPEAAKNSLLVLAVGKGLYQNVNQMEFMDQIDKESGFFIWLAEKTSTHPPLPKRIQEINHFALGEFPAKKRSLLWIPILIFSLLLLGGAVYGAKYAVEQLGTLNWAQILNPTSEDYSLITAVIEEDNQTLITLIGEGNNLDQADDDGWTALHYALEYGNLDAAGELIRAGADVNHSDLYGVTPLMRASALGDQETMELLLAKGAQVNTQDADGYTPMMYAILSSKRRV